MTAPYTVEHGNVIGNIPMCQSSHGRPWRRLSRGFSGALALDDGEAELLPLGGALGGEPTDDPLPGTSSHLQCGHMHRRQRRGYDSPDLEVMKARNTDVS